MDATDLLLRADAQAQLNVEDLEALAWAAAISAGNSEMLAALERVYAHHAARKDHENRRALATMIWCTGFHSGFDWIDLPVLDEHGDPRHSFGKATNADGLSSAGLHFEYAVSTTMGAGVGRDARRIATWIAADLQSVG